MKKRLFILFAAATFAILSLSSFVDIPSESLDSTGMRVAEPRISCFVDVKLDPDGAEGYRCSDCEKHVFEIILPATASFCDGGGIQ